MIWFIRRAKRRFQRTDFEWELAGMKGQVELVREEIGEALAPTIRKVIEAMKPLVEVFSR